MYMYFDFYFRYKDKLVFEEQLQPMKALVFDVRRPTIFLLWPHLIFLFQAHIEQQYEPKKTAFVIQKLYVWKRVANTNGRQV